MSDYGTDLVVSEQQKSIEKLAKDLLRLAGIVEKLTQQQDRIVGILEKVVGVIERL